MEKNKQKRNTGRKQYFGRPKPEFEQKIISIRRVTRVVAGGRRFSFSVTLAAGNKKGVVGLGLGKSTDTATAIGKALRDAKKNMVKLNLDKNMSIPHELSAKFSSSRVVFMPNKGKGLVVGTVARDIAKLAGIKDVTGKFISNSKNKLNNARAAMKALSKIGDKYVKVEKPEEKKKEVFTSKKTESKGKDIQEVNKK